ncbi:MAG: hypothetical protein J6X84_00755 [Treponema sp.]|nr:hypothetical protein [Treponema sp.]
MASYIAIFLSLISLFLFIIILIRFKKLFSTDSIIEKTKSQMNRVIIDVNNNANRDLELINEASRRLRALLNEADKKMESFREASQLLRDLIAEAEKAGAGKKAKLLYMDSEPSHQNSVQTVSVQPISAQPLTNKKKPAVQQSLFDEQTEEKSILKDETIVTSNGAAYKEVPLIITKVYEDKTNAEQKSNKSLKERVEKLFNSGMQIDDIAAELSCSTSEVQFIIDML